MTTKPTYSDLLQDPRWKIKRVEILERDNHLCQCCDKDCYELHVHHKRYLYNKMPWDYPNKLLITLCEFCHKVHHMHKKHGYDFLKDHQERKHKTSEPVHIKYIMPGLLKDLKITSGAI